MEISARAIGRNLKQARTALGLTQEKTAEMLNLSIQNYGRFERGERFPSLPQLALFAKTFDTSIETLLTGSCSHIYGEASRRTDHLGTIVSFLGAGCSAQAKALMIDICRIIAARDKHIDP